MGVHQYKTTQLLFLRTSIEQCIRFGDNALVSPCSRAHGNAMESSSSRLMRQVPARRRAKLQHGEGEQGNDDE